DLGTDELNEKLKAMNLSEMASELDIGELTLQDIKNALMRPGRDPREDFPQPLLKQGVLSLENLEEGMKMQGTVRNVVDFGLYVDFRASVYMRLGPDGVVHISELSQRFVNHPRDVVSVGDVVTVWVEQVDINRDRVALIMKKAS